MANEARHVRSPSRHPGVRIVETRRGFEVRFRNPRTGRLERVDLEDMGITTERGRVAVARECFRLLRAERALAAPDRREVRPLPIGQAVDDYLTARAAEVKPATVAIDREYLAELAAFLQREQIETTAEITPRDLERFREYALARRKSVPVPGRGPGGRARTAAARAPATKNLLLRTVRGFLKRCWRLDALDGIDPILLGDRLRNVREVRENPDFLEPPDLRELLSAALAMDVARGPGWPGSRFKKPPIAAFTLLVLLGGFRGGEARLLEKADVDLGGGQILLPGERAKTGQGRTITLAESPTLVPLLRALLARYPDGPYVLGGEVAITARQIVCARRVLVRRFSAPPFQWVTLRHTCGTFLTCAPAIFGLRRPPQLRCGSEVQCISRSGGASAFLTAKRLGHTVRIAEKHYYGARAGIPREARTLEAAMEIEDLALEVVRREEAARHGG